MAQAQTARDQPQTPGSQLDPSKRQTGVERVATLKDKFSNGADHQWAKWVVTNFAPTRIHFPAWTDAQRQAFLDEYAPDHIGEWAGPSLNG